MLACVVCMFMRRQVCKSSVYVCSVGWSLSAALPSPLAARKLRKKYLRLNNISLFRPYSLLNSVPLLFHWFWIFIHLFPWQWCLILIFICKLFWILHEIVNICGFQPGAVLHSTPSTTPPPHAQGQLEMSGCPNWWAGCYWNLMGRGQMGRWTSCSMQDSTLTTRSFLVQKVNSAEVENPSCWL